MSQNQNQRMAVAVAFGAAVAVSAAYVLIRLCRSVKSPATKHILHVCTKCSTSNRPDAPQAVGKEPTGKKMLQALKQAFASNSAWKFILNGSSDGTTDAVSILQHLDSAETLQIHPMQCFSACSKASCVAFSAPSKHSYHFGLLEPERTQDIEDLVQFAGTYVASSGDAWSKAADRPSGLQKANTISRLPPVLPSLDHSSAPQ